MNAEDKLAAALWEADRHVQTLQEALNDWDADPVTGWEALDADRLKVRLVDQLLFRFTKLQDTLGERLIPTTLALLREPFEAWPMRDRLNRLEKLGFLDVNRRVTVHRGVLVEGNMQHQPGSDSGHWDKGEIIVEVGNRRVVVFMVLAVGRMVDLNQGCFGSSIILISGGMDR